MWDNIVQIQNFQPYCIMSSMARTFLLLVLLIPRSPGFAQPSAYVTDKRYSVHELTSDLRTLRKKLESIHPDLYRYTPKPVFTAFFDSLEQAITQPRTEQEFLSLVTLLNAKTGDGHTMFLPSEDAMEYNNRKGHFFPFMVTWINEKLYITENGSADNSISAGEEIISINGTAAPAVMSQLLQRQIRDAQNETYPVWILNRYFPVYYNFCYGQPEQFVLELKNDHGNTYFKQVAALTKDSSKLFRQTRYPASLPSANNEQGIILEENNETSTAILTIKSFDEELLKSSYQQDFHQVIDSVFAQLKRSHAQHLILDLRNNQGGDFEPGRYLLSYLCTKPVQYLLGGKEARLLQPKANHFKGKLYVLINGGSFSNTAIISACLEREQRAVFIGEETGGNKYIISGEATEEILPYIRVRAFISTTTFRISQKTNNGHGVMPTWFMQSSIDDLLTRKDRARTFALKLITGK